MPFELSFLSSYIRSFKKLGPREKQIAGLVVLALQSYFKANLPVTGGPYVFQYQGNSYRLVFKKLHDPFWEAYIEGRVRVVTRLEKGCHFLLLVGNHDQVRQFLILRKN